MTKKLEKAVSLYTAIKHLKNHDCKNFIKHLDDEGVEVICQIIHYILNGELELKHNIKSKLKKKIKNYKQDFRKLSIFPRDNKDIHKKRKILQKGGLLSVLTSIASVVVPLITSLLAK